MNSRSAADPSATPERPAHGSAGDTTHEVSIRVAQSADLSAVLALCRLLDASDEPGLGVEEARSRFAELTSRPGHRIYVAERGGAIVGTFALIFVGGLAHSARDFGIVEDVVVSPGCRGGGIGRKMMVAAMAMCRERGCYKLALSSHLRRDEAHAFYERLGFAKHGFSFLVPVQTDRPDPLR